MRYSKVSVKNLIQSGFIVHFLWIMNVGIVSRKLLDIMRSKPSSKCINVSYSCLLKPFVFSRK